MNEEEILQIKKRLTDLENRTFPFSSPALDPTTKAILDQQTAIPYFTTDITTTTPSYNGYKAIYKSGSDYIFAIYANGGWRTQTLGGIGIHAGTWTFTVPHNTIADATTTHDFGFVPKMVFGTLTAVGSGTARFFGMWQNGLEISTSIVSDGFGTASAAFLGPDSSLYVNDLSVSSTVLTIHYKNTNGASDATANMWAIG